MTDRFTYPDGTALDYPSMLARIQDFISRERSIAVKSVDTLWPVIAQRLIAQQIATVRPVPEIAVDMAQDMAGIGRILAKYLLHLDAYSTLEEINFNGYDSLWLRFTDRPDLRIDETFISPKELEDLITRLLTNSKSKQMNRSTPGVVSAIPGLKGVRMTVLGAPIVPDGVGAYVSIRIVRPNVVTGEKILASGELSRDMLRFLHMCVKYRESATISGEKGAGKTSLLNYLKSLIPGKYRIGVIEEGARELSTNILDDTGRSITQVLSMLTRPKTNPDENYDASRLLELCLRFDLEYLIPQEMRDKEAYGAQECARTGTAVYSTLHCNDAKGTYPRIVTLCQKASSERASILMGYAVEAFPISAYMQKMPDGNRRCLEIVEAVGTDEGRAISNPLYRYIVEDNTVDAGGTVHTLGRFEQVGHISDRLRDRMLARGASRAELQTFF